MYKPFAAAADIAVKCSGFLVHGEPVNVRLISLITVNKILSGKSLLKAELALTVSGDDQTELLAALDRSKETIMDHSGFFDTRFTGISCSSSPQGKYIYTLEWSSMMFDGGE